jgi:hypothetical protein
MDGRMMPLRLADDQLRSIMQAARRVPADGAFRILRPAATGSCDSLWSPIFNIQIVTSETWFESNETGLIPGGRAKSRPRVVACIGRH